MQIPYEYAHKNDENFDIQQVIPTVDLIQIAC